MKSRRKNPLHNPMTFFTGSLQEFAGESLPLDHPIVLERERKRREAKSGARPPRKRPRKKKD